MQTYWTVIAICEWNGPNKIKNLSTFYNIIRQDEAFGYHRYKNVNNFQFLFNFETKKLYLLTLNRIHPFEAWSAQFPDICRNSSGSWYGHKTFAVNLLWNRSTSSVIFNYFDPSNGAAYRWCKKLNSCFIIIMVNTKSIPCRCIVNFDRLWDPMVCQQSLSEKCAVERTWFVAP